MRVLLYVTTHLSTWHTDCMQCWPAMLARSPTLRTADVLVYAGASTATDALRARWRDLLRGLPNPRGRIHFSDFNPGYQSGASYAMHVALIGGWFDGYDWVVRLNPDVVVLDESLLVKLMRGGHEGIFVNCGHLAGAPENRAVCDGPGCTRGIIHTDFFAVRPDSLARDAFAGWNRSSVRLQSDGNAASWASTARAGTESLAESRATRAFRPIVERRADAWLNAEPSRHACRVQEGGLRHAHPRDRHVDTMLCDARCSAWTPGKDPAARLDELANDKKLLKHELRRRRAITEQDAAERARQGHMQEAIRRGDVKPRVRVPKNRTRISSERRARKKARKKALRLMAHEWEREVKRERAAEEKAVRAEMRARGRAARNAQSAANYRD